jgi:hypothetical protein
MGFITAKVKADGRFFMASIDRGVDGSDFRDPLPPLNNSKFYWGHKSRATPPDFVEFPPARGLRSLFRHCLR